MSLATMRVVGAVALTLALIVFFVAQAIINVFIYFRMHQSGLSGWLLLDAAITLILGLMIWRQRAGKAGRSHCSMGVG